jgi:parallel beta-helix repeat protein
MKRTSHLIVIFILAFSGFATVFFISSPSTSAYTPHDPIVINGNADFASQAASESWPGDGTQGDPYIIEGYEINSSAEGCIEIKSTSVHFIIRDSMFWGGYNDATKGIFLDDVSNGTIENCTFNYLGFSIYIESSESNTIADNSVLSSWSIGIFLDYSHRNELTQNNVTNSEFGFYLNYSHENKLNRNNASICIDTGFYLDHSDANNLTDNIAFSYSNRGINLLNCRENRLSGNRIEYGGLIVWGAEKEYVSSQIIDESNTVNGKPLYYWVNRNGETVPTGAGQIILANCTNMTVENQEITGGLIAVQLLFSSFCEIKENHLTDNYWFGISFSFSDNNRVIDNNVSSNDFGGIYLINSTNNLIINNKFSSNIYSGINFIFSDENSLSNNIVSHNSIGITFFDSHENQIIENQMLSNNNEAVEFTSSHNNVIANNIMISNWEAIKLSGSNETEISNNNITDNRKGIILSFSYENVITSNSISESSYGISLNSSLKNEIIGNNLSYNQFGLDLEYSDNNAIHHNKFINNSQQIFILESTNTWDDSFGEGNWWSTYTGIDKNGDGVGDTNLPYHGVDEYPLTEANIEKDDKDGTDPIELDPGQIGIMLVLVIVVVILFVWALKKEKSDEEKPEEGDVVDEKAKKAEIEEDPKDKEKS